MAMKTFINGNVLGDADINEYLVNTKFAIKPASEARSSSPNLNPDSDLQIHVDPGKTYHVKMVISVGSPAAAGFSFGFGGPAGIVVYGVARGSNGVAGTAINGLMIYDGVNGFFNTTVNTATYGSGSTDFVEADFMLVTAGGAGTFLLKWSQNNSNASATTVRAGSWMLIRRVS